LIINRQHSKRRVFNLAFNEDSKMGSVMFVPFGAKTLARK
jgi:hypothetical protein